MKTIEEIASTLRDDGAAVQLLYAFNSVGKTRLSVAYKNATKEEDGTHAGIYYNAYSEDLFVWNNDIENGEANIRLTVLPSSLSRLHADLNELDIHAKLKPYRLSFDFRFVMHPDAEKGIESISFFPAGTQPGDVPAMKISRGEERVFVWCFFLAMMEAGGWADRQSRHIFIDDPVSSLDDHNIFVTASTLYDLIEKHYGERKIIIATHHVGMFSILCDWLMKGEKSDKYKRKTKASILSSKHGEVSLETTRATCSSITSESFSCWSKLGKKTMSVHTTWPFSASCWRACRRSSVSVGSAMHSNASASRMRRRSPES